MGEERHTERRIWRMDEGKRKLEKDQERQGNKFGREGIAFSVSLAFVRHPWQQQVTEQQDQQSTADKGKIFDKKCI